MRRWWRQAVTAADAVSTRPGLWVPGALAWTITVGWLPLIVVVARPPTVADLTFLGAALYTSGAWPWNAVVAAAGLFAVIAAGFTLVALAETILATGGRRAPGIGLVGRAVAIAAVAAIPAVAALLAGAAAFLIVALDEFTSPGASDPLVRSLLRIGPFVAVFLVAWVLGGLVHAGALRALVATDAGVATSLAEGTRRVWRAGSVAAAGAAATWLARIAYLGLVALLLRVLWAALAERLGTGTGIDAALLPLLVGFIAIWLCLVIGGGALHALAALTWSSLLGGRLADPSGAGGRAHGDPHRP